MKKSLSARGRGKFNIFRVVIFLTATTGVLLFHSCDDIEPPYLTADLSDTTSVEVKRKILLEEFTGHQCPNCPEGTETAKILKDFYGDQLIIIAIHAGFFANTNSTYSYDFTSEEGDQLNSYFGVLSNPQGIVNRKEYEGSVLLGHTAWGSAMENFVDDQPKFDISITTDAGEGSDNYDVDIEVQSLIEAGGVYNLVVSVTEDGIVSPQKTNNENIEGGIIPDYEHNYVLRTSLTDTWGEQINQSDLVIGDVVKKSYVLSVQNDWEASNISVVAYVYDTETLEVMQVEQSGYVE